tara:strand:- start:790 stop:1497 length:708 start_codon:yes stop_codon:yes gene_type:complete
MSSKKNTKFLELYLFQPLMKSPTYVADVTEYVKALTVLFQQRIPEKSIEILMGKAEKLVAEKLMKNVDMQYYKARLFMLDVLLQCQFDVEINIKVPKGVDKLILVTYLWLTTRFTTDRLVRLKLNQLLQTLLAQWNYTKYNILQKMKDLSLESKLSRTFKETNAKKRIKAIKATVTKASQELLGTLDASELPVNVQLSFGDNNTLTVEKQVGGGGVAGEQPPHHHRLPIKLLQNF